MGAFDWPMPGQLTQEWAEPGEALMGEAGKEGAPWPMVALAAMYWSTWVPVTYYMYIFFDWNKPPLLN